MKEYGKILGSSTKEAFKIDCVHYGGAVGTGGDLSAQSNVKCAKMEAATFVSVGLLYKSGHAIGVSL